jgi:hypothetical protein
LAALWAAWAVSFVALLVNQFLYNGSGIGPGWGLGLLSLALQAIAYIFVGRGQAIARGFTVFFLLLAALPLPMVGRLIIEGSGWSATYLGLGFVLKVFGVFLLFTADAKRWFARDLQD